MSTHNIGFYEDLTKIIFEFSSNIIKYAPYFFYCEVMLNFNALLIYWQYIYMYRNYEFYNYNLFITRFIMTRFWI